MYVQLVSIQCICLTSLFLELTLTFVAMSLLTDWTSPVAAAVWSSVCPFERGREGVEGQGFIVWHTFQNYRD